MLKEVEVDPDESLTRRGADHRGVGVDEDLSF